MIKYGIGDTIILKVPIQQYDFETVKKFYEGLLEMLPKDVGVILLPTDFDLEVLREQDNNIKTVYGNERDI